MTAGAGTGRCDLAGMGFRRGCGLGGGQPEKVVVRLGAVDEAYARLQASARLAAGGPAVHSAEGTSYGSRGPAGLEIGG